MAKLKPRSDGAPWRNFYGRRKGKALRPGQEAHMRETLPAFAVPDVGWAENPDRRPIGIDALFGRRAELHLEIGFGAGEHLLRLARLHPERDYIGCEPFENGIAALLPRVAEDGLENIRLHHGDARDLLDVLPAGSLGRCYLLYPDPWPKKKHHRRRFVQQDTLDQLAGALRSGAEVRLATDIPDYARHSLEQFHRHPAFSWLAEAPGDWRRPWAGWESTRYEAKALREGRTPCYLRFRRV